jgi:hypothetical protein
MTAKGLTRRPIVLQNARSHDDGGLNFINNDVINNFL